MKLLLLCWLPLFWLAFVASHAALSPEVYWKIKLPNTEIPKVIKDFLSHTAYEYHEVKQETGDAKEKVYHGVHVPWGWVIWEKAATEDDVRQLKQHSTVNSNDNMYHSVHLPRGVLSWYDDVMKKLYYDFHQSRGVLTPTSEKNDLKENFLYKPYFLEEDLEKGKVINFPSLKNKNEAPFLPRKFAESIPFSSKKISEILSHFSINNSSKDAQTIEETIKACEKPALEKEKKGCATSLESMVDLSLSMLGTNNVKAVTTEVEGETQMLQSYTIEEVQQLADGDNMVCHKINYAYAVHYCHVGGSTKTYKVSMLGVDGTKVKAVSVCHKDTSFWNPKGLPFVILKITPGTTPICHFLEDDQIVFFPSKEATKLYDLK